MSKLPKPKEIIVSVRSQGVEFACFKGTGTPLNQGTKFEGADFERGPIPSTLSATFPDWNLPRASRPAKSVEAHFTTYLRGLLAKETRRKYESAEEALNTVGLTKTAHGNSTKAVAPFIKATWVSHKTSPPFVIAILRDQGDSHNGGRLAAIDPSKAFTLRGETEGAAFVFHHGDKTAAWLSCEDVRKRMSVKEI